MPTDIYVYLTRQLENCMIRFNLRIDPVSTQITNMQQTNNYDMGTQKIPNSRVYYSYKSESKGINADKR